LILTDGINSSLCSKNKPIRVMNKIGFFLLSSIRGDALVFNDRFIGGKGGLARLKSPTVELNGVRGLVNGLVAILSNNFLN
jgi:hypothetical protein